VGSRDSRRRAGRGGKYFSGHGTEIPDHQRRGEYVREREGPPYNADLINKRPGKEKKRRPVANHIEREKPTSE